MRINQYLAKAGLGSRRSVETLIKNRHIKVNGKILESLSYEVTPQDKVEYQSKQVTLKENKYFLFYKPVGFASTLSDPYIKKTIKQFLPQDDLFPVGRLDVASEGLMLLTNDGILAQKLAHPSFAHEKEYLVEVALPQKDRTERLENAIKFFKCGIRLDGRKTQNAQIKLIGQAFDRATFNIVLREGLKRQIRRTFQKAKLEVTTLKRIRFANVEINDMKPGEVREISKTNIALDKN